MYVSLFGFMIYPSNVLFNAEVPFLLKDTALCSGTTAKERKRRKKENVLFSLLIIREPLRRIV